MGDRQFMPDIKEYKLSVGSETLGSIRDQCFLDDDGIFLSQNDQQLIRFEAMISILCGDHDFVQRQLSTDPSPSPMLFGDGAVLCRRGVRFDEAFVVLDLPLLIYIEKGV